MRLAQEEIEYFDQLIQRLSSASPRDISEIREELVEGKYLRPKRQKVPEKAKTAQSGVRNI
nr:NFACT family protein [Bacillus subtilis]